MSERILNFSEFFNKYSKQSGDTLNADEIATAASNFEEGFDKETYDQAPLGPRKPIASQMETTPIAPTQVEGEENDEEMNVPSYSEETPEAEEEAEEDTPEAEEEAEEEDNTPEAEEEAEEEDDTPEPEKEESKEEKVEEGMVVSFKSFINESYSRPLIDSDGWTYLSTKTKK